MKTELYKEILIENLEKNHAALIIYRDEKTGKVYYDPLNMSNTTILAVCEIVKKYVLQEIL